MAAVDAIMVPAMVLTVVGVLIYVVKLKTEENDLSGTINSL